MIVRPLDEVFFPAASSIIAGPVSAVDDEVPIMATELLETWQAWADRHDEIAAQRATTAAKYALDGRELDGAFDDTKQRLQTAVSNAPDKVAWAFRKERERAEQPPQPKLGTWSPGSLPSELAKIRSKFEADIGQMSTHLWDVARGGFLLRRDRLRRNVIPRYQDARRSLAKLGAYRPMVETASRAAANRYDAELRSAARVATDKLAELAVRSFNLYGTTFASARSFDDDAWATWSAPDRVREVLLSWQLIPAGVTARVAQDSSELVGADALWRVPVVGDFRPAAGFVWRDVRTGNLAIAYGACQSLVLRLLAAVPPGKARFTFIDPLGSGKNIAPFLELTEWDPLLVDTKAWCQQREIADKLSELNTHLEIVIQKYLRGRFDSIDDYNEAAGEVAEPYRFVVIFDFPSQFDEQSAHLLARLVHNGRRCGVHVIVVHNGSVRTPHGVDLDGTLRGLQTMPLATAGSDDLHPPPEPQASPQGWNSGQFSTSEVGTRRRAKLVADPAPDLRFERDSATPNAFTRVMLAVGSSGKGVNEITVTPEKVNELLAHALAAGARVDLPATSTSVDLSRSSTWWVSSTTENLSVPIGRSGARDPAMFTVDTRILSGGLLIGRPGSGKSTLLHALICGAASQYSPQEVEMYLLDFKQGVEFLPYAELGLPHARAVAIESEREFGAAILESITAEKLRRANLFKAAGPGVGNISEWRARTGETLTRVLVVIDEFHELLNTPDQLAQRCAGLLDELVRQGRAFGIHLLLGTQSFSSIDPGGTVINILRLLPIRIVLPSDHTDSLALLGERNDAARYLSRPGEGVYNAAGGNPDHNVPFQGTRFSDDQRHAIIGETRAMADGQGDRRRPVVFNGRVPAQVNVSPSEFIERFAATPADRLRLPIGLPFTLEDEFAIELQRDASTSVLFASREDQLVNGVGSLLMAATTAQFARHLGTINFVDCAPPGSGASGWLDPLLSTGLIRSYRARDLEQALTSVRGDIEQRLEHDDRSAPPTLLVVWAAHRARHLDRDDSIWVDENAPPDPTAHLEWILRNGPDVGVHAVIAGDSPASLFRRLTRGIRREFGWHIAGRLNQSDAELFEVAATSLKVNQLVCGDVHTGDQWRVRGYAPLTPRWMTELASKL